jgi:uncharacterized protein YjiS (DUF1127 family)
MAMLRSPPLPLLPENLSRPMACTPRPQPAGILGRTRAAWRHHRDRTELAQLPDRILKDIGLTRADAWREASRPSRQW